MTPSSNRYLEIEKEDTETKRKLYGWGLPVLDSVLNFDGNRGLFIVDRRQVRICRK